MYMLYATSGLILVRSAFRVVEYIMGNNGFLLRREVFLYVFDALLMFAVMALFNWIHPSEVVALYRRRLAGGSRDGPGRASADVQLVEGVGARGQEQRS